MTDLRMVLLQQIDEYEREVAEADRLGQGPSDLSDLTRRTTVHMQALAAVRQRHAEFAEYLEWISDVANDRGHGLFTMVGVIPSPGNMRDPQSLDRYVAWRAWAAELRATLLPQIEAYQRELDQARQRPECRDPRAPAGLHPLCVEMTLAALRRRHPEFADYVAYLLGEGAWATRSGLPRKSHAAPMPDAMRAERRLYFYLYFAAAGGRRPHDASS